MSEFRSLWFLCCAQAEDPLCMQKLTGVPIPYSVPIPQCLHLLYISLCNAAHVTGVEQTEKSLQSLPLCKTACGLGLWRDEPVLCYLFVNLYISLSLGFQNLCNMVVLFGDTLPSALHCLCQSPHGISFPSRKILMEQKLSLLNLYHAAMEIYAQIHMRSCTGAQLLPAPSLNTVSTIVKFHDVWMWPGIT